MLSVQISFSRVIKEKSIFIEVVTRLVFTNTDFSAHRPCRLLVVLNSIVIFINVGTWRILASIVSLG